MKYFILSLFFISLLCFVSCSDPAEVPPPGSGISDSDLQAAQDSDAAAILDPSANDLSFTWTDRFSDEESFGIESLAEGAWLRVHTVPAIEGTGGAASWSASFAEPGQYRVVADKETYSVPLHAESGVTEFLVSLPDTVPVLVVDSEEPISGTVTVSLVDAMSVSSVDYYVDLQAIASVTEGEGFPYLWDSATVANGTHLLSAMACTSPGVFLELKLQVLVETPDLAVHMNLQGTFGIVILDVSATADVGIESVESFLDDLSLGMLTSPNNGTLFRWSIDTREVSPGMHTIRSVAVDREGNSLESSLTAEFDQPPVLTVDSPVSGTMVSGSVVVSGSFEDDIEGTTVYVWFGEVPILTTDESPFSAEYDLTGVLPGAYTVRVRAIDAANHVVEDVRFVIVESADAMDGELIRTNAYMLDADNGYVLFRTPGDAIYLRSPAGVETQLPDTDSIENASNWQVCNGNVVVSGRLNGHPNPYEVFLYAPDGQRRNLSVEAGSIGFYDTHPVSQWPWVAWSSQWANSDNGYDGTHDLDVYFLLNLQTDEIVEVIKPAEVTTLGNWGYDVSPMGQNANFYYWAGAPSVWDIYGFSTDSQLSTRITTSGDDTHVQTDGQRVAWERGDNTIMLGSVESPENAIARTTTGGMFMLADGVLAWKESDGVSAALKVDDGQEVILSLYDSSLLRDVGGGYVAFRESDHLWVWDRENGVRLVSIVGSSNVEIDGDKLYANMPGSSVYVFDLLMD